MTKGDLFTLSTFILLACGVLAVMLSIAFHRQRHLATGLCLAFLSAAFASLFFGTAPGQTGIDGLLIMDNHARYFSGLLIFAAIVTATFSTMHRSGEQDVPEEFFCLLLLATLGGTVLAACTHAATLLLGLEILSISLYSMIAYTQRSNFALEAAVKYLVLASTSAAFLIFGLALLYAASGSFEIGHWVLVSGETMTLTSCLTLGATFVIVGAGFKLAVVPFHMWTPDIYQASPEPVAGFIATASKGAMIGFLLRLAVTTAVFADSGLLWSTISIIAILSMLAGNLLALLQNNLKRLLAYSSVAHMGYMLIAIRAAGTGPNEGAVAAGYYLASYFPAMLAAFGVLAVLTQKEEREIATLEDLRGLAHTRPFYATVLSVTLLSLAGLPLTSGFMGKLYIIISGVEVSDWGLVAALVIGTVIGIYYYLRVLIIMFAPCVPAFERPETSVTIRHSSSRYAITLLAGLVALIIWLGVQPYPFLKLIAASVPIQP